MVRNLGLLTSNHHGKTQGISTQCNRLRRASDSVTELDKVKLTVRSLESEFHAEVQIILIPVSTVTNNIGFTDDQN